MEELERTASWLSAALPSLSSRDPGVSCDMRQMKIPEIIRCHNYPLTLQFLIPFQFQYVTNFWNYTKRVYVYSCS